MTNLILDFQTNPRYCCRKTLKRGAKGSPYFTVMGFFYARTGRNRTVLYPRSKAVIALDSPLLEFCSGKGNTVFLLPKNQTTKGYAKVQQHNPSNSIRVTSAAAVTAGGAYSNQLQGEQSNRILPGKRSLHRGARYHAGNHVLPIGRKSTPVQARLSALVCIPSTLVNTYCSTQAHGSLI